MKILRAKLGKKTYPVIRDDESVGSGVYEDGEWIPPQKKTVYIKANIQPAFQGHYTKVGWLLMNPLPLAKERIPPLAYCPLNEFIPAS